MNQKVYVISQYYPHLPPAPGQRILYVFNINDNKGCISEVELEWGQPRLAIPIEEQRGTITTNFKYFKTYDEAYEYVKLIKELNK